MRNTSSNKGYTLIETLVALGLFSIIISIATTVFITFTNAHRRVEVTRGIIDNLDFTLEEIVRTSREGRSYNCGSSADLSSQISSGNGGIGSSRNCADGSYLSFEGSAGDGSIPEDQIIFRLNNDHIEKSTDGGITYLSLTDPSITISDLKFTVTGAGPRDGEQARILIILRAVTTQSGFPDITFDVQTSVTQRFTDL